MYLSAGATKLSQSLKLLRVHWDATEKDWNDIVRQEFEKNHIDTLEEQVRATLRAINELAEVLYRAEQECA